MTPEAQAPWPPPPFPSRDSSPSVMPRAERHWHVTQLHSLQKTSPEFRAPRSPHLPQLLLLLGRSFPHFKTNRGGSWAVTSVHFALKGKGQQMEKATWKQCGCWERGKASGNPPFCGTISSIQNSRSNSEMCNLILIVIHHTRQVSSFRLHWATTSLIFMICAQHTRLGIKLKLFRSQHFCDHGTGKRHRTKQHPPKPLLRHLKQLTQK